MKYCISCEKECSTLMLPDGDEVHPLEFYKDGFIPCYGMFTNSIPPELPEDWELLAVEPEQEFMVIGDANAEILLLEMKS